MLFGEHAVVYGHPCLVTAVNLRVTVSVAITNSATVKIFTPTLNEPFNNTISAFESNAELPESVKFVGLAIKKFWAFNGSTFGVEVRTGSEFVNASGLGSSSAVTVATLAALAGASGVHLRPQELFQLGFDTVLTAQQGRASGFDVASATFGGTIYYKNQGREIRPVQVKNLPLMTIHSGVKASTPQLVGRVATLRGKYPQHVDHLFAGIAMLVQDAVYALEHGNLAYLGRLMNFNQGYLQALGVSTGHLDSLLSAVQQRGACGAKISGAGGGDCIIAVAEPAAQKDIARLVHQSETLSLVPAQIDAPGARIESISDGALTA